MGLTESGELVGEASEVPFSMPTDGERAERLDAVQHGPARAVS